MSSSSDSESTSASPPEEATERSGSQLWTFDFGTSSSPVAVGAIKVTDSSTYNSRAGWGWLDTSVVFAEDRGSGEDLDRDFHRTRNAVFQVDLADGWYDVSVRVGDTLAHAPALYAADSQLVGELDPQLAGEFETRTLALLRVTGGRLLLQVGQPSVTEIQVQDGDAIINGLTIERRELPRQRSSWTRYDATLAYRRVTEAEAIANGWSIYDHLVHASAGFYPSGSNPIHLVAPYGEGNTQEFDLAYDHDLPPVSTIELGYGKGSISETYGFTLYTEPGSDAATVVGDPRRRALSGWLEVGVQPTLLKVRSGEPTWVLDPILLPDGSLPNPMNVALVAPTGGDLPVPVQVPAPPDAWSFAMVGEIKWCTNNPTGWGADLAARALLIRDVVHSTTPGDAIQQALLCNITNSIEVAETCASGGNCPLSSGGNTYSFFQCLYKADCYNQNVRANLLQARAEGHFVPEIHLAQTVHDGKPEIRVFINGDWTYKNVCGWANFPGVGTSGDGTSCDGNIEPIQEGANVVGEDPSCDSTIVSPHEVGHNLGATHSQATALSGESCMESIMDGDVSNNCSAFGPQNAATIGSCAENSALTTLDMSVLDICGALLSSVRTNDCPIKNDGALVPAP